MSNGEREELAALVRGWTAYFEWARECGAALFPRTEGIFLQHPTPVVRDASPAEMIAQHSPPTAASPARMAPESAPVASAGPSVMSAKETANVREGITATIVSERDAPVESTEIATTVLRGQERVRALRVLEDEARACRRCRLCEGRTQAVFSRGNCEAELFFVGEAPGADEDLVGKPFVGAAGRLLDRILAAMGLSEDDVYIANVVKCRPPGNRTPHDDEAAACGPFLDRQLALVRPNVIVAWGRTPTRYLLNTSEPLSKLRGNWYSFNGIAVLPTWHPAYLLRNPVAKKDTWADMKRVLEKLGRSLPAPTRG